MKIYSSIRCLLLVFLVTAAVKCSGAASNYGEVEDEHEFDYTKNGERGPERWGKMKPEWIMCGKGKLQSPIDLLNQRVRIVHRLGKLLRAYKPSNATLKNRGHDMMLKWEDDAGNIRINGIKYKLQQAHWHSPSEHTINGRRFALEMHMVHESRKGRIAVVAVLYKIGRPDTFLQQLENHLERIRDSNKTETQVGMINPKKIKIGSRQYYRYVGSLTTPPCRQNVLWTIVKKVRTVTREQVKFLRVAVHDKSNSNSRPIQPRNSRPVRLYKPNDIYK